MGSRLMAAELRIIIFTMTNDTTPKVENKEELFMLDQGENIAIPIFHPNLYWSRSLRSISKHTRTNLV